MMKRSVVLFGLVLALAMAVAALEVPFLSGRVNDLAGVLPDDAETQIEAELARLEEETGAQMAVLTIESLEGDPLEDFSLRVVETWQLGQKGQDNGVLLLIAVSDRKMRLEVGYGLEGVLTDATSRRILDNVLKPAFRKGDFGGGVLRAVEVASGLIRGEGEAPDAPPAEPPDLGGMIAAIAVFGAVIGVFSLSAIFGKGFSSWFLYFFLTPFYFGFPAGFLGLRAGKIAAVMWLIGFPILHLWLYRSAGGRQFRTSHPGWVSFGSGSGSGGGGFSGFSGGGGSFGGGGASGGW